MLYLRLFKSVLISYLDNLSNNSFLELNKLSLLDINSVCPPLFKARISKSQLMHSIKKFEQGSFLLAIIAKS